MDSTDPITVHLTIRGKPYTLTVVAGRMVHADGAVAPGLVLEPARPVRRERSDGGRGAGIPLDMTRRWRGHGRQW